MPTEQQDAQVSSTETIRDIIIGMSDGLTVPFALAAGLTGAVAASHLVLTAGLAEIVAGSISMGLGGYLAAGSDAEFFANERRRKARLVKADPDKEIAAVTDTFHEYGISPEEMKPLLTNLQSHPEKWLDFKMRFELGLEEPHPNRALVSALTIAISYIVGGAIPLAPYFFNSNARIALLPSVVVTLIALALFGYFKGKGVGTNPWKSTLQTVLIGGIAAGCAFLLARLIS